MTLTSMEAILLVVTAAQGIACAVFAVAVLTHGVHKETNDE